MPIENDEQWTPLSDYTARAWGKTYKHLSFMDAFAILHGIDPDTLSKKMVQFEHGLQAWPPYELLPLFTVFLKIVKEGIAEGDLTVIPDEDEGWPLRGRLRVSELIPLFESRAFVWPAGYKHATGYVGSDFYQRATELIPLMQEDLVLLAFMEGNTALAAEYKTTELAITPQRAGELLRPIFKKHKLPDEGKRYQEWTRAINFTQRDKKHPK